MTTGQWVGVAFVSVVGLGPAIAGVVIAWRHGDHMRD